MRDRITKYDLEQLVKELNTRCGHNIEPHVNGKPSPNNYHLYWAYGGVALDQMMPTGSGTRRISHDGCSTKRKLYDFLTAYLEGMSHDNNK